jgi:hypothetical protein
VLREQLTSDKREANNRREHTSIFDCFSAVMVVSMGTEIESPPRIDQYCFRIHGRIYRSISQLDASPNMSGYGLLHIFESAEGPRKQLENQTNHGCIAEAMQRLDERQGKSFPESNKSV